MHLLLFFTEGLQKEDLKRMDKDRLRDFWNERFSCFGHTGWKIAPLYSYDQSIRLKAVKRMLSRIGFVVNGEKSILDIGCGTGDFVREFAKNNAKVMGFDLSDSIARSTTRRFQGYENVRIWCSDVAGVDLPSDSFDLITSITVLQHVVSNVELLASLKTLSAALKEDGYFILIESISRRREGEESNFYMKPRSRQDWIALFQETGLEVAEETSYPHLALCILQLFGSLVARIKRPHGKTKKAGPPSAEVVGYNRLYMIFVRIILAMFKPIDYWLFFPLPVKYSKRRVFVLTKRHKDGKVI